MKPLHHSGKSLMPSESGLARFAKYLADNQSPACLGFCCEYSYG
ncbi:hypothetical protein [Neisseria zoodegmatis]|nr:hypothetical protein [Neisseria zoodegmatis]